MEDKKCLVELDEILSYLSEEDLNKIPFEIRQAITEEKDKLYQWKYDENKELNEQNINRKTVALLSYLNMEYLLDEEQRLLIEELHKLNENKEEEQKRKVYNSEMLFKKEFERSNPEIKEKNNNEIIEYKESFFTKFKNFIFRILRVER